MVCTPRRASAAAPARWIRAAAIVSGWCVAAALAAGEGVHDQRIAIAAASHPLHLAQLVAEAGALDASVRAELVERLGTLRMPGGAALLRRLWPGRSETEATAIVEAWLTIGHGCVLDDVLRAIDDARPAVAAHALAAIADARMDALTCEPLRAHLRTLLARADHPQRVAVALALRQVGTPADQRAAVAVLIGVGRARLPPDFRADEVFAVHGDRASLARLRETLEADIATVGRNAQQRAASAIGEAVRAGWKPDAATRAALQRVAAHCTEYDPAHDAAEALGAVGDAAAYAGLLSALATTNADRPVLDALWAIDPARAAADCTRILADAGDQRGASIAIQAYEWPQLEPALLAVIGRDPATLDQAGRSRRSLCVIAYINLRWPTWNGRSDRAAQAAAWARYLRDADPHLAAHALGIWARLTDADVPDDLAASVRERADGPAGDPRSEALSVIALRPWQFPDQLRAALARDGDDHRDRLLMATCDPRSPVPAAEVLERIIVDLGTDQRRSTALDRARRLFAGGSGRAELVDAVLADRRLSAGDRGNLVHAMASGGEPAVLARLAAVAADLGEDLRWRLMLALGAAAPDPGRYRAFAKAATALATEAPSEGLQAALSASARQSLAAEPDYEAGRIICRGVEELARLAAGVGRDQAEARERLRADLLVLAGRWRDAARGDREAIARRLRAGEAARRWAACVEVQMALAAGDDRVAWRTALLPALLALARSDAPDVRAEACRAIAAFGVSIDAEELTALILVDPAVRHDGIAALIALDREWAGSFLLAHRDDPRLASVIGWRPHLHGWLWRIGTPAARAAVLADLEGAADIHGLGHLLDEHRHDDLRAALRRLRERGDARRRWEIDRILLGAGVAPAP